MSGGYMDERSAVSVQHTSRPQVVCVVDADHKFESQANTAASEVMGAMRLVEVYRFGWRLPTRVF